MARGGALLHQILKVTLELADRSGTFNNALRQMIVHSNESKGTTRNKLLGLTTPAPEKISHRVGGLVGTKLM